MQSYQEANERLGTRQRRKLENNTYLERRSETSIAVRLHHTDVITYLADDRIILRSGGWRTITTKDRLNTYSPVQVYQRGRVWYVILLNNVHMPYNDGLTILHGNVVTEEQNGPIRIDRIDTGSLNRW